MFKVGSFAKGDSQPRDSTCTTAPWRAVVLKIIHEDFKRHQADQERRIESILAQTELLRQANALVQTQLEDQRAHIQVQHQSTSTLDHLHHQDNNDVVEPLDHAVPFSQIPYTILISHGGHRPYDLRILRILVTEGVDEVDITFQRGPNPQYIQIMAVDKK